MVLVCFWQHRNPLNTKLNPICHLLALWGAHPVLHISRIRVKPCELIYCHVLICSLLSASMFNIYHLTCSQLVSLPPMLIAINSEIRLNIVLLAVCQSFRWLLSHLFFHKILVCIFVYMCVLSPIVTTITSGNILHYTGPKIVQLCKWYSWCPHYDSDDDMCNMCSFSSTHENILLAGTYKVL
jgi:hypothetical protein